TRTIPTSTFKKLKGLQSLTPKSSGSVLSLTKLILLLLLGTSMQLYKSMDFMVKLVSGLYCEEDCDHDLYYSYFKSNIVLQKRVSEAEFTEVDNMLADVLTRGRYYVAPSNLLVISKNITEKTTELLGVLRDLKSQNFNILISSLEEKDDGSVSLPGFAEYQITSVPEKHLLKLANANEPPNIGVFWNFDSSHRLISPDSHLGQVSIWAYCDDDDDDLFLPDITMIPTGGNRTARFKRMLKYILLWALLNPVDYPRTLPCLMVISDIAGNRQFAKVLQLLVTDDYTVLLTVSDEMEYLRSPPQMLKEKACVILKQTSFGTLPRTH
ncbi:unnamed protein product, partial [Brassica oleracea var. botrytis]